MKKAKVVIALCAVITSAWYSLFFFEDNYTKKYSYNKYVEENAQRLTRNKLAEIVNKKYHNSLEKDYSDYLSNRRKYDRALKRAIEKQHYNEQLETFERIIGHKYNPDSNLDKLEWKKIFFNKGLHITAPYSETFCSLGFEGSFYSYLTTIKYSSFPTDILTAFYWQSIKKERDRIFGSEIKNKNNMLLLQVSALFISLCVATFLFLNYVPVFVKCVIKIVTNKKA